MPLLQFNEQYAMFDITPVENLFIEEFMLRAPGDFVKVYIYGLKLCYHASPNMDIARMAQVLGLEEDTVRSAFIYWERFGVVRKTSSSPESYSYLNVKQEMLNRSGGVVDDSAYQYKDFIQTLQDIYGADRLFHPQDFQRIYDWIEVFGMKEEAILLLVKAEMDKASEKRRPTIATLDKRIRYWAEKDIKTLAAVEDYLHQQKASYEGARLVLRHLRIHRNPTVDEETLYIKWTGEWAFSTDAILHACDAMTGIPNPNFKYLDKVLQSHHAEGRHTSEEMQALSLGDLTKSLLAQLGGGRVTEPRREKVQALLGLGFTEEALQYAARLCAARGGKRIEDLEQFCEALRRNGLTTVESLREYEKQREAALQMFAALLAENGDIRQPYEREIAGALRWMRAGYSRELLSHAYALSRGAQNPLTYMDRVLKNWKENGISTVAQAQSATASQATGRPGKEVAEHRYAQREYASGALSSLIYDPFEDEK